MEVSVSTSSWEKHGNKWWKVIMILMAKAFWDLDKLKDERNSGNRSFVFFHVLFWAKPFNFEAIDVLVFPTFELSISQLFLG
jgi:hypothetical protein